MWDRGRLEDGARAHGPIVRAALARRAGRRPRRARRAARPLPVLRRPARPRAAQRIETALDIAEALLAARGARAGADDEGDHARSPRAACRRARASCASRWRLALEHDKPSPRSARLLQPRRHACRSGDRYEDAATTVVRDGLAHARRVGNRYWEWSFLGQIYPLFALGEWDEALAMFARAADEEWEQSRQAFSVGPFFLAMIHLHRGNLDDGRPSSSVRRAVGVGRRPGAGDVRRRMARILLTGVIPPAPSKRQWCHAECGMASEQVKEAWVTAGGGRPRERRPDDGGRVARDRRCPSGRSQSQFLPAQALASAPGLRSVTTPTRPTSTSRIRPNCFVRSACPSTWPSCNSSTPSCSRHRVERARWSHYSPRPAKRSTRFGPRLWLARVDAVGTEAQTAA